LSSPAASLDRIAIVYNKYDEIYISPKNREDFIKELLKINSDIIVDV
jgi:Bacterial PH domain